MTTWADPPAERDPRAPESRSFLAWLIEALTARREPAPDPGLEHYGPCDRAQAPEAGQ